MKPNSITWQGAIPQLHAADSADSSGLSMNEDAFAAFYQRTARPVWSYLVHVSGNPSLADDLLQESYLRFLCAARLSEGEAACRRYLFRIATNLLRDHWRQRAPASLEDLPEGAFATDQGPDIAQIDSQKMLARAFHRLRPRERQLLWLAYAEGATHAEIAEITGLRTAGIRILLFRARRKLARLLKKRPTMPQKGS
ncbi:MAG TPA: sigma-70 family RNA polymerase sigma factor [Candidatus Dormibacteraeota bacterium]|nr:sigma-70 family RNA polymerase sigma factor [Candidatus Dormibacteraeota bacterium]